MIHLFLLGNQEDLSFKNPLNQDAVNMPTGSAGSYQSGSRTYASTLDSINDLVYNYYYDDGFSNQTLLVMMHPWSGGNYTNATKQRWADLGCFVIEPGMRGFYGASGSEDASGKSIHDIYDAIIHAKANYALIGSKTVILGYSGGGGNALAFASKCPDQSVLYCSFFGPSDYGFVNPTGWWYTNNATYGTQIEARIGGTPAAKPNEYRSRNAVEAITKNIRYGYMMLFHDTEDPAVNVVQSRTMNTAMQSFGHQNYEYSETTITDNPRWEHGTPNTIPDLIQAEPTIWDRISRMNSWNYANVDTVRVIGFMITSQFKIVLGDGVNESNNGTNRVADVSYNVNSDTYNVIPLFESGATQTRVIITQGAKSANQIITGQTIINVV